MFIEVGVESLLDSRRLAGGRAQQCEICSRSRSGPAAARTPFANQLIMYEVLSESEIFQITLVA